ncbi:MAG: hypothetical protein JWP98_18 [Edaphobacter sp.]|nr:hypothetical protein [Edaphobacter sp.]
MPLCGRLFSEAKLLFLFDLRAEMRLRFGCGGLTGKNRERGSGAEDNNCRQQQKAQWLRRRPAKFITASRGFLTRRVNNSGHKDRIFTSELFRFEDPGFEMTYYEAFRGY